MAASQLHGALPDPNENKRSELLHTIWVLCGISTVVVALRVYTKISRTRRLYWDDALMVLALALGILYTAFTTMSIHFGLGRHYLYLSQRDKNQTIKWGVLTIAWGILTPMVARISFCITMLFLAGTDSRVRKWPIWFFIALQILVNVSSVFGFYLQCGSNLDIYWTPTKWRMMATHCWDPSVQTKLGYFAGSINCATDAFLTILPAVLIEHTKLSWKKKIGLASLLCLSVVALVASIVKTYAVKALMQVSDYTYDLAYYVIWTSVEMNVVITVTSLPLIRPLFRRRRRPPIQSNDEATWDTVTLHSTFSTKGGSRLVPRSMSSQENIMPDPWYQHEMEHVTGITVVREVSVTYQPINAPFVHAALVGLVQGEIANPPRTSK